MRDFFATPACDWRRDDGSLHLYVVPDVAQRAELAGLQDRLSWPRGQARQPAEFLHATVLRLPWFRDELSPQELASIQHTVGRAAAGVPAFELDFDTLDLLEFGVVVSASPTPGWDLLVNTLEESLRAREGNKDAAQSLWMGRPFGPHASLSYGREDAPDGELTGVVNTLSVRQRWAVRRVELLSVSMHKGEGTFSWVPISSHELATDNGQ